MSMSQLSDYMPPNAVLDQIGHWWIIKRASTATMPDGQACVYSQQWIQGIEQRSPGSGWTLVISDLHHYRPYTRLTHEFQAAITERKL